MLVRGPKPHETAYHQVGEGGQEGYPGQMHGSVRPICFHHENLTAPTYATHTTRHHKLLLLVSTASCEAVMGLKQCPMKPKGAFPLTQWALDQAQHLFGPLCIQRSQFILYPFLGLSLQ